MADITVQTIVGTGILPTATAAASGGDTFTNGGRTFYHVINGGGSTCNVTFDSQLDCDQGFDHNFTAAVLTATEQMIGPFPKPRFNNASEKVTVSYDQVATVTVAAIALS